MAAPNEYYVRPTNGSDAADGLSHANAWKTLEHAVTTVVQDSTDGDRINMNDEADNVLSAALDIDGVGQYGNPANPQSPLIIQGYTSVAGDGGIGGISGGGSVSIVNDSVVDAVNFVDMHLHNCGSAVIVKLDNNCRFINCEFDNTSGDGLEADFATMVCNCHFHNIGGEGCRIGDGQVLASFFKNGTNDFNQAIIQDGQGAAIIAFNVISLDGSSDGIHFGTHSVVHNNTIYASSGTGEGISSASAVTAAAIFNNYIEGFSGTGGDGLLLISGAKVALYGHNKFFNNTADETLTGDVFLNLGNNDVLGSSALTDPSSDDFTVSTLLKALGYPSSFKGASTNQFLDVGAAQRQEPAGGGGLLVHPGMTGGVGA